MPGGGPWSVFEWREMWQAQEPTNSGVWSDRQGHDVQKIALDALVVVQGACTGHYKFVTIWFELSRQPKSEFDYFKLLRFGMWGLTGCLQIIHLIWAYGKGPLSLHEIVAKIERGTSGFPCGRRKWFSWHHRLHLPSLASDFVSPLLPDSQPPTSIRVGFCYRQTT